MVLSFRLVAQRGDAGGHVAAISTDDETRFASELAGVTRRTRRRDALARPRIASRFIVGARTGMPLGNSISATGEGDTFTGADSRDAGLTCESPHDPFP
jgi:hypothetical protein